MPVVVVVVVGLVIVVVVVVAVAYPVCHWTQSRCQGIEAIALTLFVACRPTGDASFQFSSLSLCSALDFAPTAAGGHRTQGTFATTRQPEAW